MKTIIIGGGIAGVSCAGELRRLSPKVEITVISEEGGPLYSRLLLPHYIRGQVLREKIFLRSENWYQEQGIKIIIGRAEKVDYQNKFVATSDGRELPFDKLVIASGRYTRLFNPLPLGELGGGESDKRGVSYLWRLEDADHLKQLINEVSNSSSVAVYGGGLIACEFINIFKHFDFKISVAFRGEHFWSRILNQSSGEIVARHLESQGIEVLPRAQLLRLEGEEELSKVVTDKKNIDCRILGVGIGLEPDTGWLKDSGLKFGKGIIVNEKMETNLFGVYAIGDVAEVFDIFSGRHRIMGTWVAAQGQGKVAARNLVGQNSVFDQVTISTMKLLGLDVVFLGDVNRGWADEIKDEVSLNNEAVQIFYKNKKVIGATLVNRNNERAKILSQIKN